jgi:hypothetical protein
MPTLYDMPQMVRPFWVIDRRLAYHTAQSGRLLYGLAYDPTATHEVRGVRDLPFIMPYVYTDQEAIGPGAKLGPNASPQWDTLTANYWLSARRDYGLFQADPTGAKYGILDWVAKVRDAIETDEAGVIDDRLSGMASRPITFAVRENDVTEMSWSVLLEVVVQTDTYGRGTRDRTGA